jgi:putative membrane protein
MISLLARWIVNAAALLLVAYLYPGVHVDGFVPALLAALVLGLVNAVVRPILVILTLLVGSILYSLITLITSWLLFSKK